jgi:magnesium and cobalt transporter
MDADALTIIEGALAASDTRVTDVMIPRAQMYVVDIDDPMDEIIPVVIEAAHSRFPVINGDRDKVLGVLLAKDLLRIHTEKNFDLRDWLRPVVFIPNPSASTSCSVNSASRAITWRSWSTNTVASPGWSPSKTCSNRSSATSRTNTTSTRRTTISASIPAAVSASRRGPRSSDFNEAFSTTFSDEEFDTVGGLVLRHLGRVPKRNEIIDIDGTRFQVLRADSRRLYTLLVTPPAKPEAGAEDFTG